MGSGRLPSGVVLYKPTRGTCKRSDKLPTHVQQTPTATVTSARQLSAVTLLEVEHAAIPRIVGAKFVIMTFVLSPRRGENAS